MLNVTSALIKGLCEYRRANGYELAPMDGPVAVKETRDLLHQALALGELTVPEGGVIRVT